MFGAVREWNRVSASLEKRVVSRTLDDGRDPTAYGDRGILLLCSIRRCSMSAMSRVSRPRGESVFRWGTRERRCIHTYKTAKMVLVYMLEGGGQQDQFRLRFHPPIVGSALDVCQWVSRPIVQHISVENERAVVSASRSARSRSPDFPFPHVVTFNCTVHPQATILPSIASSGPNRVQSLSQQWPQNWSVFPCLLNGI